MVLEQFSLKAGLKTFCHLLDVTLEEKITLLFDSQSEAISQFLAAIFGNSDVHEIEDVTQETFLRLYKTLRQGEQIENMHATGKTLLGNWLRSLVNRKHYG
ncbi:MAG: hypothetical protein ACR2N3_06250 [Pyrinomonadaceae bacterium]